MPLKYGFEWYSSEWVRLRLCPFKIHVWRTMSTPSDHENPYEVVIHYGENLKTISGFESEEIACKFAINEAIRLLKETLKELEKLREG